MGPLGQAAVAAGVKIGVLVDVDLGMRRTGVATAAGAVELARLVSTTSGLRFDGLMGYEGHTLMIHGPGRRSARQSPRRSANCYRHAMPSSPPD